MDVQQSPLYSKVHYLLVILALVLILTLRILEPLQEGLGGLANLLAGGNINVFFAGLGTPCLESFLIHEVILVVGKEDGRDLGNQSRVVLADETLGTAEEGLLMTLRRDERLEETSAGLDLLGDLLVEDTLGQDGASLVLGLDAELLGLLVDLNVADVGHTAILGGGLDDPAAKLLVGRRAIGRIVLIFNDKGALEVRGEILSASLHGLLGDIDGPVVILDLSFRLDSLGLPGHLIVTASFESIIAVLVIVLRTVAVTGASVIVAVCLGLLGLTASFLVLLVLLPSLGVVPDNEGTQLETGVDVRALTAGLAVQDDLIILDTDVGLGILALLAEHKLGDKSIKIVLELCGIVGAVDDPTVIGWLGVSLSTELKAKVLDDIGRGTAQRLGNRVQVDNDGLDTIALALNLGLDFLHLVAVEGIGDIPANIDSSHVGGWIFLNLMLTRTGMTKE